MLHTHMNYVSYGGNDCCHMTHHHDHVHVEGGVLVLLRTVRDHGVKIDQGGTLGHGSPDGLEDGQTLGINPLQCGKVSQNIQDSGIIYIIRST